MKLIEDAILEQGTVLPGNVLKVDSFLNHKIDVELLRQAGAEFFRLYRDCGVNKILTVESSGIGVACLTAIFFGCDVVFAKKAVGSNSTDEMYSVPCFSFTKNKEYSMSVSKKYVGKGDRLLIIDDFLAGGNALNAMLDICGQAGAEVVGCGIVIEKAYQLGGDKIREKGIRVESLARIASMSDDGIVFCS